MYNIKSIEYWLPLYLSISVWYCSPLSSLFQTSRGTFKMHIPSLILAFVLDFLGQILTEDVCCPIRNNMSIDLTEGVFKGNILGTIQPTFGSSPSTNMECGTPAHLTMDFDNFSNSMSFWKQDQCISSPTCGQRMLRVDMFLGKQRSGCMFHVGDSLGNDDLGNYRLKYKLFILEVYFWFLHWFIMII